MWSVFDAVVFVVGYVASIYSWPVARAWVNGVTAEAASLRAKAAQLESKIRAL